MHEYALGKLVRSQLPVAWPAPTQLRLRSENSRVIRREDAMVAGNDDPL